MLLYSVLVDSKTRWVAREHYRFLCQCERPSAILALAVGTSYANAIIALTNTHAHAYIHKGRTHAHTNTPAIHGRTWDPIWTLTHTHILAHVFSPKFTYISIAYL